MVKFVNRAMMTTHTTGTGNVTLLAAVDGYHDFDSAGVGNGDVVPYTIEDGDQFEIGQGVYNNATKVLTRIVEQSSNNDAKINLSGDARVYVTLRASDVDDLQTQIDGKSASGHGHSISDVSGLQAALDGKATSAQGAKADSAVQPQAGHGLYPNADKTKLAGIATNATKNATDAQLRDRSTHTGSQPISTVSGLQSALNDKLDANAAAVSADKLTTPRSIALSGDVSGSTSFDGSGNVTITATVANNSHTHTIANIGGLQNALDGKATAAQGAKADAAIPVSEKGALNGVAELDGTGKVPASQLPSYVDDVLEYANRASFPASGRDGTLYIDEAEGDVYRWTGSAYIQINDAVSSADQATKLATARTISLSGDATGSVSFDGSANKTLNVTVKDNSHNHTIANVDGLQTALDSKLAASANAVSASKLSSARTISLGGDLTGSTSFDGSGNVTINASVKDDSHSHIIGNIDGLQTALDGKEAERTPGEPHSNLGTPSVREMALFDAQFNNKIDFYDPNLFWIETSNDGVSWTETADSETHKRRLVGGDGSASIVIPHGTPFYRIRMKAKDYVYLNAVYFYWSGSGNTTKVKIQKKHKNSAAWQAHTNSEKAVGSWPGHLYLSHPTIPWHPNSDTTHLQEVAVVFEPNWGSQGNAISLYRMQWWGGYPAGRRNVYSTDEHANVSFPADISAANLNVSNWDTAYSWGDHATEGYLKSVSWGQIAGKPGTFSPSAHSHPLSEIDNLSIQAESVQIDTSHGYIQLGPKNGSYCHVYTDRPSFYFNKELQVLGKQVFHTGYHPNADKLTTARTISLSGDASGSVSFDGSGNVTLPVTIANNSHSHTIANISGLQTALDDKLAASANAVSASKLSSARTISLSGDASGSVSFDGSSNVSINVNVADDSHNHTIANIDGLQDELNSIDYPWLSQNPYSYDGSTHYWYLKIAKADAGRHGLIEYYVSDDVNYPNSSHGYIRFSHWNNSTVSVRHTQVWGDTQQGIEVFVDNSDNLWVRCPGIDWGGAVFNYRLLRGNITMENTRQQAAPAAVWEIPEVGRGYRFNRGDVTAGPVNTYDFNTHLGRTIKAGPNTVFHDGYHPNADRLTTARTISLSGDLTGSATFDGSSNVTISASVKDDSHNHTIANVDGLQTALNGKASSSQGSKADTAYGWGNHASAGYLTTVPFASQAEVDAGTINNKAVAPDTLKQRLSKVGSSYARQMAFGG